MLSSLLLKCCSPLHPQGMCSKAPGKCLKLQIVPNPTYTVFSHELKPVRVRIRWGHLGKVQNSELDPTLPHMYKLFRIFFEAGPFSQPFLSSGVGWSWTLTSQSPVSIKCWHQWGLSFITQQPTGLTPRWAIFPKGSQFSPSAEQAPVQTVVSRWSPFHQIFLPLALKGTVSRKSSLAPQRLLIWLPLTPLLYSIHSFTH